MKSVRTVDQSLFAKAYISGEGTKKSVTVLLILGLSKGHTVHFVGPAKAAKKPTLDVFTMTAVGFDKTYIGLAIGDKSNEAVAQTVAREWLTEGKFRFSTAALDALEGVLKMDTRGKSTTQISEECSRIAADLPEGHPLRKVHTYPDRASAIAAYTAIRQALFSQSTRRDAMATKKVTQKAEEQKATEAKATEAKATEAKAEEQKAPAKAKADKDAKGVAKDAKAKAGNGKAKADFSGKYQVGEKAAKVKTTEELGMHEDSVRTKVLAVVLGSKAKNGVDYSALEAAAGDKTRGAVAYLVKKGYLVKAAA